MFKILSLRFSELDMFCLPEPNLNFILLVFTYLFATLYMESDTFAFFIFNHNLPTLFGLEEPHQRYEKNIPI